MKIGIIVCSRKDSTRVPLKPFRQVNGLPLITNLLGRLKKTKLPVILAIPEEDAKDYKKVIDTKETPISIGYKFDPLTRMKNAAEEHKLDAVVRVTHDKIFVDPELILQAVKFFKSSGVDYLFSTKFTAGSGFEIVKTETLRAASKKFKNVEYLSYAIRACANSSHNFEVPTKYQSNVRLLIDFEEDLKVAEVILSQLGNAATLSEAINFVGANEWLLKSNKLPKLTFYTCAYNSEKWIEKCMDSVLRQKDFHESEYILIDDFSSDETPKLMAKFASQFKNVRWYRNQKNLGLASSSNIAIERARGKYVLRLDADDYFTRNDAANAMLKEIEAQGREVIYPCNYFGSFSKIQKGNECHHVGGALFDLRAVNHIKFTEGLRGFEGLDLFMKSKEQLNIGYLNRPIFFYTQRPGSLSKTNLKKRAKLKKEIEGRAADV